MNNCAALLAIASLLVSPLASFADHHEQRGLLDKVWTFVPKNGSELQFQKAFAEHAQWRRDNKDPWRRDVYVEVDGPEVGARHARSSDHHWSDFDAYDASAFSAKASAHWNTNVAPHLADIRCTIAKYLPDISNWTEDAPEYRLFQLHRTRVRIGQMQKYIAAVGAIAKVLKDAKWPYHWGFHEFVSGPAPTVLLVLPSMKWADMADPKPDLWETMAGAVGEEKSAQMWADLDATIESTEVTIVRHLPDLTVMAAQK